ncbi:hypothetical protein PFISCL1PPCAC_1321, partial [Pristionchus fissidentatus]
MLSTALGSATLVMGWSSSSPYPIQYWRILMLSCGILCMGMAIFFLRSISSRDAQNVQALIKNFQMGQFDKSMNIDALRNRFYQLIEAGARNGGSKACDELLLFVDQFNSEHSSTPLLNVESITHFERQIILSNFSYFLANLSNNTLEYLERPPIYFRQMSTGYTIFRTELYPILFSLFNEDYQTELHEMMQSCIYIEVIFASLSTKEKQKNQKVEEIVNELQE